MPNPDGTQYLPAFAPQWLTQWRTAAARLEELRRQELRAMTEADAARIFAQLDPARPYELRPTSGLVEQQRWFGLLRATIVQQERTGEEHPDTRKRPATP